MKSDLGSFVKLLKSNDDLECSLNLPVLLEDGKIIGTLRLVDIAQSLRPNLPTAFTKWRQESMTYFLSQFHATENRTKEWIEKHILPTPDRLLFEVLDDSFKSIGHVGVSNLTSDSAELDNFIRGERGGDPNLFRSAEYALMLWLFTKFNLNEIYLYVFSNNWIAINNHLELGFSINEKINLSKIENAEGAFYVPNADKGIAVSFFYLKMILKRNEFFNLGLESKIKEMEL